MTLDNLDLVKSHPRQLTISAAKTWDIIKSDISRLGITYAFDNSQIITVQDNIKYLGDVPFSVYFDFEAITTAGYVFLTQKCL